MINIILLITDDAYDDARTYKNTKLTAIESLVPNTSASFRGVVLWKKEGFLANDKKTYISRLRVGDKINANSIVQITAFNSSGRWIEKNIQVGVSYQFEGLKLRKSNHQYVPLCHAVECLFNEKFSMIPVKVPTLSCYPTRMYCELKPFNKILTMSSSTCIEVIGIVLKPGKIYKSGNRSVRKITHVDKHGYKIQVMLWDEEVYSFVWKEGTTLLVQGLKVMFSGISVSFPLLRCRFTEVNPQIEESTALKKWWFEDGGSTMNFLDFGNFENRFDNFVNALNAYNAAPDDTKPTNLSLATLYNIAPSTHSVFFIGRHAIHVVNPVKFMEVNEGYKKTKALNPLHTIQKEILLQKSNVKVDAVRKFRTNSGQTKLRQQRKRDGEETKNTVLQFKQREAGQRAIDTAGHDAKTYGRLRMGILNAGLSKPKQVGKIARAILLSLRDTFSPLRLKGTPYKYYDDLAAKINAKEPDSIVKGPAIRMAVEKYKKMPNWESEVKKNSR